MTNCFGSVVMGVLWGLGDLQRGSYLALAESQLQHENSGNYVYDYDTLFFGRVGDVERHVVRRVDKECHSRGAV